MWQGSLRPGPVYKEEGNPGARVTLALTLFFFFYMTRLQGS